MMPEIIAAVIGALLWELMRFFAPKSWYFPLLKIERKIRLRNEKYSMKVQKAYKINNDSIEPEALRRTFEESFKKIFSKQNVQIIAKEHDYKVSAVLDRSDLNINFDATILPKGEYPGEEYQVILKQSAKIKFKSIENGLNAIFWNLTKFYEGNIELIRPSSGNVEVEMDAGGLKVFTELFDKVGVNIIGENVTMHQENGNTIIKLEDALEIECCICKQIISIPYRSNVHMNSETRICDINNS